MKKRAFNKVSHHHTLNLATLYVVVEAHLLTEKELSVQVSNIDRIKIDNIDV